MVRAVHRELHAAESQQVEPGCRDDQVGRQLLAGREPHARLGEGLELAGDDRGPAGRDRLEEIAVGHETDALVPGVVARVEVGVDVVVLRKLAAHALADQAAHPPRPAAARLVEEERHQHVLPAHDRVDGLGREHAPQAIGERITSRERDHVARRALEHRHVLGAVRHRRDERDGGGAASDHHDPLARVVDVAGPVLRVDDPALEALAALELRQVALVVAVVARAAEQEAAGHAHRLPGVRPLGVHGPARIGARPLRPDHPVPEADPAVDAVLARRIAHVVEDRRPIGDRLRVLPRPERVAERVHVRVRADARVAEQVPGPADRIAGLEDRVGLAGAARLEMVAGADARQARADDQHVQVLGRHYEIMPDAPAQVTS